MLQRIIERLWYFVYLLRWPGLGHPAWPGHWAGPVPTTPGVSLGQILTFAAKSLSSCSRSASIRTQLTFGFNFSSLFFLLEGCLQSKQSSSPLSSSSSATVGNYTATRRVSYWEEWLMGTDGAKTKGPNLQVLIAQEAPQLSLDVLMGLKTQ